MAGMDGIKKTVKANTTMLIAAKNSIATVKEVRTAIRLVTGTPSTIPAETPINTFATALADSSGFTAFPASVRAMDT